jgi:hypothetical protein
MTDSWQSNRIIDYVFPLCTVADPTTGPPWRIKSFLGTGFLIGNRGFALTAAHVIPDVPPDQIVAVFVRDGRWWGARLLAHERHPTEDVGIVRLAGEPWRSFFRLSNTWEGSSKGYQMWGYPEDVAHELEREGRVITRPDLVYAEGYLRRRVTTQLPRIRGSEFFEVSEVVGPGCSGSPLYVNRQPFWDVIGIYVGERLNHRSTSVAYAVREDAFRDWVPSCLRVSVLTESLAAVADV